MGAGSAGFIQREGAAIRTTNAQASSFSRASKSANIAGIHRMPFGVVAATGLAHLTLAHGSHYMVEFNDGSLPQARVWKVLPGAPFRSGLSKSGDLLVACVGGNVLNSPAGEISMASPDMGEKAGRRRNQK